MIFSQRTVTLRNDQSCLFRSPGPDEAAMVLEHLKITSGETPYLLRYPDERTASVEEEADYLRQMGENPKAIIIGAYMEGVLVGTAGMGPLTTAEKYRHRTEFGVSVQQRYWGLGIGGLLLAAAEEGAQLCGYSQLELEVACKNSSAIALYERRGFVTYGRRPRSFGYRDGSYDDALLMYKMI